MDETEKERLNGLIDEEFNKEYPQMVLICVFILNFFASILVNIDHGALPACTEHIKAKMNIGNFGYGSLGTVVYIGLTFGSMLGTKIYSNSDYIKPILTTSLVLNAVCLVAFGLTPNFKLNLLLRFTTGLV